jgi:hypothetical protein
MVVTIESDVAFRNVRTGAGEKLAARVERLNSSSNFIVRRGVRFEDRMRGRMYPKQGSKENVEGTTRDSNHRWRTVGSGCIKQTKKGIPGKVVFAP